MSLTDFKVGGYRSVRNVWLKMRSVNVIVGPNGCGKSNLYKSIYLLHCAAKGELAQVLAEEGGIESALWAGPRKKNEPATLRLSVRSDKYEYFLEIGVVGETLNPGPFSRDPEIRSEDVFLWKDGHRRTLIKRRRNFIEARDSEGQKIEYTMKVLDNESVLSALRDVYKFPELAALRDEFLQWRFYHNFRTDADSPMRKKQIGVKTPVLSHDGHDVAAAFLTIQSSEDRRLKQLLSEAMTSAFPDSVIGVESHDSRRVLKMTTKGISRPLDAREFSDGTLQYICLCCALLSLRPPSLIALNEPETSLNPNLYEPLAKLIVEASVMSQIWLTTHAIGLSDAILDLTGYEPLELKNVEGQTQLHGVGLGGWRESDEEFGQPEP